MEEESIGKVRTPGEDQGEAEEQYRRFLEVIEEFPEDREAITSAVAVRGIIELILKKRAAGALRNKTARGRKRRAKQSNVAKLSNVVSIETLFAEEQ